jgi:hypothetical protein
MSLLTLDYDGTFDPIHETIKPPYLKVSMIRPPPIRPNRANRQSSFTAGCKIDEHHLR